LQKENSSKTLKPYILGIQGHSKSSMMTPLNSSSQVLVGVEVYSYITYLKWGIAYWNIEEVTGLFHEVSASIIQTCFHTRIHRPTDWKL